MWIALIVAVVAAGMLAACAESQRAENSFSDSSGVGPAGSVYSPDLGNGSYRNPIIFADYSDPDVVRVGSDFYLTASSFTCFPGLPILHSKDLVNWTIIGNAITKYPLKGFELHRNGDGVWAPSIRYHDGHFYIYFGDPDYGVFMAKAANPAGPWDPLVKVHAGGKGWIDTCPFWDDDGKAYMIHAFAGSRSGGKKNILHICRLSPDGTHTLDEGQLVLDGAATKYNTIEGPKLYKRDGWYYIFCPGGGVSGGYQVVARSKNIYGPYESHIVMKQGEMPVNGPHQGAWINTSDAAGAQDWFVHFQDDGGYGRITHLQPMAWQGDWPVIGEPLADDATCGQPVLKWKKTDDGDVYPVQVPQTSDEFITPALPPQWQWFGNYQDGWASLTPGHLHLRPVSLEKKVPLFQRPNLLTQKTPCDRFTVTTQLDASHLAAGEWAGLLITGAGTAALQVQNRGGALMIVRTTAQPPKKPKAPKTLKAAATQPGTQATTKPSDAVVNPKFSIPPEPDIEDARQPLSAPVVYLRLQIQPSGPPGDPKKLPRAVAETSFSLDGEHFTTLGKSFAVAGEWVDRGSAWAVLQRAGGRDAAGIRRLPLLPLFPLSRRSSDNPWRLHARFSPNRRPALSYHEQISAANGRMLMTLDPAFSEPPSGIPPLPPVPLLPIPKKPNPLRFLLPHNPAFLLSATCMFLGCYLINSALDVRTGETGRLIALLATINIYEVALLLLGVTLLRRAAFHRDGTLLLLIQMLFLTDAPFLLAQSAMASAHWLSTFNVILLAAAIAKCIFALRALKIPLHSRTLGFLLLQLTLVYCALPLFLSYVAVDGVINADPMYLAWWVVGLLPLAYDLLARIAPLAADISPQQKFLRRAYIIVPWLFLIAHLAFFQYAYRSPFVFADLSPALLGLAIATVRLRPRDVTARNNVIAVRVVFITLAMCFAIPADVGSPDTPHILAASPQLATFVAAVLTAAYCIHLHLALYAACVIASLALARRFGPSPGTVADQISFGFSKFFGFLGQLMPHTATRLGNRFYYGGVRVAGNRGISIIEPDGNAAIQHVSGAALSVLSLHAFTSHVPARHILFMKKTLSKHPPQFFLSLYGWTYWFPLLLAGLFIVLLFVILQIWWLVAVFARFLRSPPWRSTATSTAPSRRTRTSWSPPPTASSRK